MTNDSLKKNSVEFTNIIAFERPKYCNETSYDQILANREDDLHEELKRIQVLRRHHHKMVLRAEDMAGTLVGARGTCAARVASLTPRQHEILDLVVAGLPSKIIAWKLGISQRTVENHRAAIMQKTGSKSLPALAQLVISAAFEVPAKSAIDHLLLATLG